MTCRHGPNDPDCSKNGGGYLAETARYLESRTPNPKAYDIERAEQIGESLVMMVKYSSCPKCDFDSCKVMVFENCAFQDAIHWREIDPHFSENRQPDKHQAPAPSARYPASDLGWTRAKAFAYGLIEQPMPL